MERLYWLQQISMIVIFILMLVLGLSGVMTTVRYQKNLMDVQGARLGLRKSITYFLLAFLAAAILVLISDPTNWLSSLCLFVGGSVFVLIYFAIRNLQLSTYQTNSSDAYSDSFNTQGDKK